MDKQTLIQAVIDALTVNDDSEPHFWTTQELCHSLGWGVEKTRTALSALKKEGKLGVTRKSITNLSGNTTRIPAYYLINNGEKRIDKRKSNRDTQETNPST